MRVRALRHCDAMLPGGVRALFEGQFYELPDDVATRMIAEGLVESLAEPRERARNKAVQEPQR